MLVFFEISGAFLLAFRIVYYYYTRDRTDALSWFAQLYGASTLMITPFWRLKEHPHYVDVWWQYWLVPHWSVMLGGAVVAIIYSHLHKS